MQDVLDTLEGEHPDVLLLAYLDDVYLQGPATAVEAGFRRVLALPLSAQVKLLLLRKCLQMKMLHWSCAARKPDILGVISKVKQEILAGILRMMKCSDAQVTLHRSPCQCG